MLAAKAFAVVVILKENAVCAGACARAGAVHAAGDL